MTGYLSQYKVLHNSIKTDYYVLKGVVLEVLDNLGYEGKRVLLKENDLDVKHFHPYQSVSILINNEVVGIMGKLHPKYMSSLKLKDVYYCELLLDKLVDKNPAKIKAPVINKYPSISRDISIVLKDEVKADDLVKTIKKAGGSLVKNAEVFDIYKGEHIESGYKSVSLNIIYESADSTLKTEEVNEVHTKILEVLNNSYGANIRN